MVATPSAITAPQRIVASNLFKVVLANVDILAANAQTLAASRCLREALKSCSQRHLRYCMPRYYYRARQPHRNLDHPNASCRRLHGLGVAHRCTQSQEYFMRVFSHAQTRPEITLYPKSARNGIIRQTARATPGAPRTTRPSKCATSQSKHELEAACPYTKPRRKALHT